MENVIVCEKCFENIARSSVSIAKSWMMLCCRLVDGGFILYETSQTTPTLMQHLETLERLGHIVTTENGIDKFKLRMEGEINTYFCIRVSEHDAESGEVDNDLYC